MDRERLKLNYEPVTEPAIEGVPHDADRFVVSGNCTVQVTALDADATKSLGISSQTE